MAIIQNIGFYIDSPEPIDGRGTAATIAARNALPEKARHEGLAVYVAEDQQWYQLRGGIENTHWVNIESSGGLVIDLSQHSITELGDVEDVKIGDTFLFIDDSTDNVVYKTADEVRNILNVEDGAEVNVQSDWDETDVDSDAYILNKPTLSTQVIFEDTPGNFADLVSITFNADGDEMTLTGTNGETVVFDGGTDCAESVKFINDDSCNQFWEGTLVQYNALTDYSDDIYYHITDDFIEGDTANVTVTGARTSFRVGSDTISDAVLLHFQTGAALGLTGDSSTAVLTIPTGPLHGYTILGTPSVSNCLLKWTGTNELTWSPGAVQTFSATFNATGPSNTTITYSPSQAVTGLADGATGTITATIAPNTGFRFVTTPTSTTSDFDYTISGADAVGTHTFPSPTYDVERVAFTATFNATGPANTVITYSPSQTVGSLADGATGTITATIAPATGYRFVSTPSDLDEDFDYTISGTDAVGTHTFGTAYNVELDVYDAELTATGPANTVITYDPSSLVTGIANGSSGAIVASIAPSPGFEFITTPASTSHTFSYTINSADATSTHTFASPTYDVRRVSFAAILTATGPNNTTISYQHQVSGGSFVNVSSGTISGLVDGSSGTIRATIAANTGYTITSGTTTYDFAYAISNADDTDSVNFGNAPQNVVVEQHNLTSLTFDETSLVVNGSGDTLNINVNGVEGTPFTLAMTTVDPAGWITVGALGASSGTIPASGQFETTVTIPATSVTVDRTAAIIATNSSFTSNTVTSGLFRQQHSAGSDGDLMASAETVITGSNVTISGTVSAGDDFPIRVKLFDFNPVFTDDTEIPEGTSIILVDIGTTTQGDIQAYWNVQAGTTGVTYSNGDTITLDNLFDLSVDANGKPDDLDTGQVALASIQTEGALTALGTHTFTAIDTSGFSPGDYNYYVCFTDSDGDIVVDTETFTIDSGVGFLPNLFTRWENNSEFTTTGFNPGPFPVLAGSSGTITAKDSSGNALTTAAFGTWSPQTQINPGSQVAFLFRFDNSESDRFLDDTVTFTFTQTDVSPNVELLEHDVFITRTVGTFSQVEVGYPYIFQEVSLLVHYNGSFALTDRGITSHGVDWIAGEQTSVPVASNRWTNDDLQTGSTTQLNRAVAATNLPSETEISIRGWVSDGTDFIYGPIQVLTTPTIS